MSETQIVQLVALVGFLVLVLGSLSIRRLPLGFILKTVIGWAAIAGVIYLVVVNRHTILDQLNTIGSKVGISEAPQVAEGETIRIQLSPDGHFWARATINGVERRMLIDSGATVSAISEETAQAAGIDYARGMPVSVSTANGTVEARRARAQRVEVGPLGTDDLTVFVASSFGDLDVLGMNFLSRLKSWRVEGNVLILEPQSGGDLT
ncbi:TIGR02281 family clan AA aspartic protease [Sphingomonas koreensis]|uniref:TIGR02281 family clan AA aspartic protease n=1 Tax=Sphingomonas koreensis TaxID=93064 RepID=A0A2M8W7N9_9SPHN|nr:TIGR02281 family clan AA aspartic protease [Sphingomonas koreensis]PJI86904.1 aspartyl protease family protein [Sphingomonas koreensis]RSU60686.1 TIGR02281 family clan AA aspartic protease [Sphingomonas koreensis]RSU69580.1 TIGR02281 family clan AA aspartic protease [Sphingomonas koreensis]RSY90691.1 TIGR02281 family clan AA aspartic protease [Sphingomonas koreensis]